MLFMQYFWKLNGYWQQDDSSLGDNGNASFGCHLKLAQCSFSTTIIRRWPQVLVICRDFPACISVIITTSQSHQSCHAAEHGSLSVAKCNIISSIAVVWPDTCHPFHGVVPIDQTCQSPMCLLHSGDENAVTWPRDMAVKPRQRNPLAKWHECYWWLKIYLNTLPVCKINFEGHKYWLVLTMICIPDL